MLSVSHPWASIERTMGVLRETDVLVALRKQSSGRTIIAIGRCAAGRRNRAWRQPDLKVFLFGDGTKRYGLKVSYNNGQLPPAFTPTKGFQFGLVVESSDDKQSGEPANNQ